MVAALLLPGSPAFIALPVASLFCPLAAAFILFVVAVAFGCIENLSYGGVAAFLREDGRRKGGKGQHDYK
jgi:hypothetical protein